MNLHSVSKNIFTLDSFLTEKQCQKFIEHAESEGFRSADVNTGKGRSHLTHIRNNDRVDWVSEDLAKTWWNKLLNELLPEINGKKAIGLSPRFRFYRYTPGQKFNMHKDGRQEVSGNITMMTFLVYLNEGYEGGSTKFRQDDIEIHAVTGQALLFEHHLWHQGTKLESGSKYLLRTDIVFQS
ncbi:2OG-Fe(II) oxygenase [Thalassomonas sp. RHCl1]|uniref:2OG-Fe(II) oxygenase n=1 Tax=Thalassomonas sp. RHCl1 TaxID=2995320 RepID=UPI00248B41E9|nr:2OG-Fe(II) oxygenase [Thalassomonas sp. RHCl1]